MTRPPRFARGFLRYALPATPTGSSIAGDLEEEWSGRPPGLARDMWFSSQAVLIGGRYLARTRLRAGFSRPDGVLSDARAAVRSWRRAPLSVGLALVALTLGVGANTAVFSVLRSVVLAPLPYDRPGDLFRLWDGTVVSKAVFERATRETVALTGLTAAHETRLTLIAGDAGTPVSLLGLAVTPSHLAVLGVRPALGRDFLPSESTPGSGEVVILSDGLWRSRFGADPSVIGRTIDLGGSRTVIGVMGRRHEPIMPNIGYWIPMVVDRDDVIDYANIARAVVIARRRPGWSAAVVREDLTRIAESVRDESPGDYSDTWVRSARANPLAASVVGRTGPTLWALQGAVLLVLLTGIANVASLLLARGARRRSEIAVRAALGASRARILRQLATESLLLGVAAGVAGLAVAAGTVAALRTLLPADTPRLAAIEVDALVAAFAIGLSLLAGLAAGGVPAFRLTRSGTDAIVGGRPRIGGDRSSARLQFGLVAAEIAATTMLVTVTALVLQSGWRASQAPLGFVPDRVLTVRVRPQATRYATDASRVLFFEQVIERVRGLPGASVTGALSTLPMQTAQPPSTIYQPAERAPGGERTFAHLTLVFPRTFETLGMSLKRGRDFDATDRPDGPRVVVVNEALARAAWGTVDVIGRELLPFGGDDRFTVVGVLSDVRAISPELPASPAFYLPYAQYSVWPSLALVTRTATHPVAYADAIRRAVWAIDPTVPIEIAPLRSLVRAATADGVLVGYLLLLFGGLALLLGAVGVYGVVAHTVSERRRELGIRLALGAHRGTVVGSELRRAALTATAGILSGLAISALSAGAYAGHLYGVSATDPLTLVSVAVALLAVTLAAAFGPALRAARVDPMQALRTD